jgi:hypothetical protein
MKIKTHLYPIDESSWYLIKGGMIGMASLRHGVLVVILIAFLAMGAGIVSAGADTPAQGPFMEFRLVPDETATDVEYGRSVATDGDLVAVGAGGDGDIGAVYLYKRQGVSYELVQILEFPEEIPDGCPGSFEVCPEFGRTVGIQGNTVLVGARFAPVDDLKAGAVYVFLKRGDDWQYEAKIVSPTPEAGDNFGRALAIQGNLLVVTARKTSLEEGAAYVFVNRGGEWYHQQNLSASDSAPGAYFGQSVAVQGEYLAIGARNANPNGAGGVYIFRNTGDGWVQIDKEIPEISKNNGQYGFAVALSGNLLAVGARRVDNGSAKNTGAVYVYTLTGDSVDFVQKLIGSDTRAGDEFGQSVAIARDIIAVGAWKDDVGSHTDQGSISLFQQIDGEWMQIDTITASDGMAGDEFGCSLAAFGNRMVTGAHKADLISEDKGAAYVLPLTSK